jgi:hypothetical protein
MVSLEFAARDIILRLSQSKKKQPLFKREAVGPGLLTLALLII